MLKNIPRLYRFYLGFLFFLNLFPILAPVLWKLGESITFLQLPAKMIYLIYSFTCHQFDHRSIHLFDYQLAWCARDTAIWLAIFVVAYLYAKGKIQRIPWYWAFIFAVPMALDGGIQTLATITQATPFGATAIPSYVSVNPTRFMTGALFGIGISLWLSPLVMEIANNMVEHTQTLLSWGERGKKVLWQVGKLTLSMLAIYMVFITLWFVTSPNIRPSNLLDSENKFPQEDAFIRRRHGPCPSDQDDFVQIKCLIG